MFLTLPGFETLAGFPSPRRTAIMGKWASVNFTRCDPAACNQQTGVCHAVIVCKHKLLLQEVPYQEPMLISTKMCVGCSDCVKACPLGAITILCGY